MPVTEFDILVLALLARYYVLTREQIQTILFPDHSSGRCTRKRLTKLRHAGLIQKHRIPVALPGTNGAA
ncbi:MAG: replication-relaxation family protein, partial [Planctomycetaceae bacterium]|nr:replication-relaxation family protein [Planctomycetaceae bacterium]